MSTKNRQAMAEVNVTSPPQLTLLKALWSHKKHFDKLCRLSSGKTLLPEHLASLLEEFESHWSRLDYVAINLGHEPVTPRYAESHKLRQVSKARLSEVSHWLKELDFRPVAELNPQTLLSGMNSLVLAKDGMEKGEICLVLNEGVDNAAKSPVTNFVECYGEGIQTIAIDIKRAMPNGFDIKDLAVIIASGGFTFMTRVYEGETPGRHRVFQCSTDEIDDGFFFSLVERDGERGKFPPEVFQGLYEALERNQTN